MGTTQEILAIASENTNIVDLKNKTLIPGFIAAHEHPTLKAIFSTNVNLSGFTYTSQQPMWENLKHAVNKTEEGEWIFAVGLDPVLMPDLILPKNPLLIISKTMHSFWANSLAFESVGVNKQKNDPGNGSYYGRKSNGELSGFISESAAAVPFIEKLKSPFAILERYENTLDELVNYSKFAKRMEV